MNQLHEIQRVILGKLQFAPELHYSQMKPDSYLDNKQFDFHLKQLMKRGLIKKEKELYVLSEEGKKYIASLDTQEKKIVTGGLNIVLLVCTKELQGERHILIYTREKQPFFGCQGYPAGKVKQGESIEEAARRELQEETSLIGTPKVKGLIHLRSYSKKTKEFVQDKYMYVCHFENPQGELTSSYEGVNQWIKSATLLNVLKKPFFGKEEYEFILQLLDTPPSAHIAFREQVEITSDF